GDVTESNGSLWGAGLSIRRHAYLELFDRGFRPLLTGRAGRQLTTGEDVELCFAFRLAGWRIWYDPRLRMQHFMPRNRLSWQRLRGLERANGAASVSYAAYLSNGRKGFRESWPWQVQGATRGLFRRPRGTLLRALSSDCEGSVEAL